MRPFTKQEDDFLKDNFQTIPAKRMSKMLGRTEGTARQRMKILGLVVPHVIVEKFKQDSRFKKGRISFNKGKKQTEFMSAESIERCKVGRFKRGGEAINKKPLGTMRVTKDGYLEIKVSEPNKWEHYHRLMWEETFGEIPGNKILRFITDDKLNVHPFNLELIDRRENMKRNTIHRLPAELRSTIQLLGALNRQINKRNEKH